MSDEPDELLPRPGVDVVVIATPNDTHFDLARRALLAGKHVVVDKPFTVTARRGGGTARPWPRGRASFCPCSTTGAGTQTSSPSVACSPRASSATSCTSSPTSIAIDPRYGRAGASSQGRAAASGTTSARTFSTRRCSCSGRPALSTPTLLCSATVREATDYFHVLLRYERLRVILHGSMLVAGAESALRRPRHGGAATSSTGSTRRRTRSSAGSCRAGTGGGATGATASSSGRPREGRRSEASRHLTRRLPCVLRGCARRDSGRSANPVPVSEAIAVMRLLELARESAASGAQT